MSILKRSYILAAMCLLSACSSISLPDARDLAQTGSDTTTAMSQEFSSRSHTMTLWWDRELALQTFTNPGGEIPEQIRTKSLNIASLLYARAKMLDELKNAYSSMGNLAAYDATGQAEQAMTGFMGSANSFIDTVNATTNSSLPNIDQGASAVLGAGFGLVAEEALKRKVKKASGLVQACLEKIVPALEREKEYAASLDQSIAQSEANLRSILMKRGIATYQTPTEELIAAVNLPGLKAVKDVDAAAKAPEVKLAFEKYLGMKAADLARVRSESYDLHLNGLRSLIEEHKKFEAERPLNFSRVREIAARLQGYAKLFNNKTS